MSKEKEIVAFVDGVGRVIVGRLASSTKTAIDVVNPAVVNIQIQQNTNQIAVQLLPFFFREFIAPAVKDKGVTWTFQKTNIVMSPDLELEDNIQTQYKGIFEAPEGAEVPSTPGTVTLPSEDVKGSAEPEVVKLFDE
tara:strand:+ start:135 stop:545 length:411 start_codon:yes stop_codon:yes gene_type:complete